MEPALRPTEVDVEIPFVPLDEAAAEATVSRTAGGWTLEILLDGATVDELVVGFDAPVLLVRRGGRRRVELRYALLVSVDPHSIRASFEDGRLQVAVRRQWGSTERIPIHSGFLWEGRVGYRPGEPLRPRPRRSSGRI